MRRAHELLATVKTWTRGRRKADGVAFVLFPGSKPGTAWYTRVDGAVCDCPGFAYRQSCAHALAAQLDTKWAREAAARKPLLSYDDIMGPDDDQTVAAF
jgi:hypothetical protein